MNRLSRLLGAASVTLVAALPPAVSLAQGKPVCTPNAPACTIPAEAPRPTTRPSGPKAPQAVGQRPGTRETTAQHSARRPAIGASTRGSYPFQRAQNSRFAAPPRGQEYRVVSGYLVLGDIASKRVVSVLGVAASLLQ